MDRRRLPRRPLAEQVIYELHIGTFTPEGTFDAAIEHLPQLAQLGVTAIEVMPVAEFPGEHGWGYDGVYLSAAQSTYGGPLAFQRLVDAAHRNGLAVILDVVYNHVGASGNQALAAFGPYFTDKYSTFWGNAINYDDEHCRPRARVGAAVRRGLGARLPRRRPAPRRDPRDLRHGRGAAPGRSSPSASTPRIRARS